MSTMENRLENASEWNLSIPHHDGIIVRVLLEEVGILVVRIRAPRNHEAIRVPVFRPTSDVTLEIPVPQVTTEPEHVRRRSAVAVQVVCDRVPAENRIEPVKRVRVRAVMLPIGLEDGPHVRE